ncbi:DUF805 domain-containing protein [Roseomonas haemaphysalidis]|uniref:DUF805 domain-containing protein n=1 Tax=Roseomonas haemaphysalidis TaxID=2768162 RepID=A0ABS3KWV1_9PROT|nr:DUF805 domain-containing protein [Roseomonas haemaphysalidis]MBO1081455.1 DUF805 domain-containing protein [Roseomonas haemaphysalidis]
MTWFSPRGRIGRGEFWLGYVLPLSVLSLPVLVVLSQEIWRMGAVVLLVLLEDQPDALAMLHELMLDMPPPALPRFFMALAGWLLVQVLGLVGAAKRWHDLGQSGWWNCVLLVPVLGWGAGLLALGFLRGEDGGNRYGPGRGQPAMPPVPARSVPAIAPPPPPPPSPPTFRSPWG